MKKTCSSMSALLEKYFDRETTPEETSSVKAHLQECPFCRDLLAGMERLQLAIRGPVDRAEKDENFYWTWQKIEKGVRETEQRAWKDALRGWFDLRPRLRKRVWVPAAMAVALILIVVAPYFYKKTLSSPDRSVVEYVESQHYNVMVYDLEKEDVTVIWLFEGPEREGVSAS